MVVYSCLERVRLGNPLCCASNSHNLHYSHSEEQLSYWRTYTGIEVDAIIGDARVAIEIKSWALTLQYDDEILQRGGTWVLRDGRGE